MAVSYQGLSSLFNVHVYTQVCVCVCVCVLVAAGYGRVVGRQMMKGGQLPTK